MEKTNTPDSEAIFIEALKTHSRKSFNELYDRYSLALLGIITRMVRNDAEAEDLLQETFIKVWKGVHHHDPTKGRLFTWLAKVARNTVIDHVRVKKNAHNVEFQLTMSETTFTGIDHIGFQNTVCTTLPKNQWDVIQLIYFQGFTHQEASDYLALPLGTVKTRTRSALGELRTTFSKDYQVSN